MEDKPTIKIVVATHKKYRMPEDAMYIPLHVGAEEKQDADGVPVDYGYTKDNTGDNISVLNASFCELTGLYWAWKNLNADYIGLVHYRRHFCMNKKKQIWNSVLTYEELENYLGKIKVFIPNKRRYYIETLYSHYKHTHYIVQLDETRKIIAEKYPDYIAVYDKVVHRRHGYMFNMMIMDRETLDAYCSWLFDILFTLREKVNMTGLSAFQGRYYGRISEIIFNVWLDYQLKNGQLKKEHIREIPSIHMEKIDWGKKITAFLKAKYLNQKYEGSF